MEYFLQENQNNNTLIVLFHGTGGNQYQLLPISGEIMPDVNTLSFLGNVGEGTERRFFAPLKNNQLDRDDFNHRTKSFIQFWNHFIYEHSYDKVIFLGYSNGANFILGLLEQSLAHVDQILLLHPAQLNYNISKNYHNTSLIITAGANDYSALPGDVKGLAEQLKPYFKKLHFELLDSGHELVDPEIELLKSLI
ncbi:alpha/beta hydrolase [Mammaliicoccus lentus]|uniref:alpha/beta hydrolase n=1 Tax=Mammaliicoccus lentus TaxID=42858 RepID=UPI001D6655AF|nr:hypothetical protein [Mammaliicoccus lentus]WGZ42532.1 hypothetical protein PN942_09680 [Mammaliicoccus lentus]HJF20989.1 hypothetical protein [Mammaliicoccus lentus]